MTQWNDSITNNPLPYNPSGMDFELAPTDSSLSIEQLTTVAYIKCNSLADNPKVVLPVDFNVGSLMFISNTGTTEFTLMSATGLSIVVIPAGTFCVVSNTPTEFTYSPLNIAVSYVVSPSAIAGAGLAANTDNTKLNVQGEVTWVDTEQYIDDIYTLPTLVSGAAFIGINQGGDWILPASTIDQVGMILNLKNSSPSAITVKCHAGGNYAIDFAGLETDPWMNQSVTLSPNDSLVLMYTGRGPQDSNPKAMYYILSHDTSDSNFVTETLIEVPTNAAGSIQLPPYAYLRNSLIFQDVNPSAASAGDFIFTVANPIPHMYFLSSNLRGLDYTITVKFSGGGQGKQVTLSPAKSFIALTVTSEGLVSVAN